MTTTPTATPARSRPSIVRRVLLVVALVVGFLLVLAGVDRIVRDTASATQTLDAEGVTSIAVDTPAGEVAVTASDRSDVAVVSTTRSGLFSDADVDVRREGSQLLLAGDCDGIGLMSCEVAFEVEVPRSLAVPLTVDATAGEIDLRGISSPIEVRTTAGAVRLLDFSGETATVLTTAGEIDVDAAATTRALDLKTTAGSIDVTIDDREPLQVDVDTTVGSQSVSVHQAADADRTITARTTAGEIRIAGR